MNRRQIFARMLCVLPLSSLALTAKDHGKGKGKGHDKERYEPQYFRREDYVIVQRYYAGPRELPPGLRKKYYRTGTLPPGWETRIRPFPVELVRVLPPPPPNCERGYIDGVAVVYDRRTRIILDTIDLVAAITGH